MASNKKHKSWSVTDSFLRFKSKINRYFSWKYAWSLLVDPRQFSIVAFVLFLAEIIVNTLVIKHVNYTEIDWIAYMQEVEGVVNGTFDYSKLKGDTGPLVYPGGFLYVFGALYFITGHGSNIRLAQYIFAGFYLILLVSVFVIYNKTKKVPPYAIIIACCTSYRIHSIFVLRMFNDCVAVLLVYLALNLFLENYWSLGSIVYSIAVSVKMNILLYAPALLVAYYYSLGVKGTIIQLLICGFIQILLGLPFLIANPIAYIKGSFDLGRIFLHQWTVNWRFLPESIFVSRYFHISLLVLHLLIILIFLSSWKTYLKSFATLKQIEKDVRPQLKKKKEHVNMSSSSQLFILPMITCNFIGVACSRSLHYQFYVWYFHTLPYLLWSTPYSDTWRLIIMGVIELCWNTYPSSVLSSAALHISHIAIMYGLYKSKYKKQ
ncbi:lethal(2)neighbour of tid protein [Homalodisca vitripennis]|uniref:lethal(2)neighbour of tid protein n=1 Tax=Homalodisca vitripennis TaxID=197043 RepID=UPI001EEAFB79|nr:lethal(2)neighbour of tid protein [Homalodisca vitripennis]KAG8284777.1 dolichyl-P-Man:Man(5)GlcNAc(2)-PP-dolichol alpha-1,3-mannosyltransferase [Homalodisca vitripennis]KAG8336017.1 dolichyl-P-Man:Man(5)GlcNAc(2)-PP-dolichol alpha-1,3-mannosyltransferase [Homalodisca vitripennis]